MKHYSAQLGISTVDGSITNYIGGPDGPGISTVNTDGLPNNVRVIGIDTANDNRIVDVALDPTVVNTTVTEEIPFGTIRFFQSNPNRVRTYDTTSNLFNGDHSSRNPRYRIVFTATHPSTGIQHSFRAETNYHQRIGSVDPNGNQWRIYVGTNWQYSPSGTFDGDVTSRAPWFSFQHTPCSLEDRSLQNYQGTILSVPTT